LRADPDYIDQCSMHILSLLDGRLSQHPPDMTPALPHVLRRCPNSKCNIMPPLLADLYQ
jgi:hypothetical protein